MKKAVVKRWVAALRSGKYKKCKDTCFDGERFCAFGVLLDVEIDGWWVYNKFFDMWTIEEAEGIVFDLHERFGISDREAADIENLNDNGNYSFKKIAEYIEKNL